MRKSKKFALAASACMTMLAFAIGGTLGVLKVSALGDLSEDVTVTMVEPATSPEITTYTVFTPGGQPPATLTVEVEAAVMPITTPAAVTGTVDITPSVDGVDFALNAAVLNGSATTADDVDAGVTSNPTGMPSQWEGIIDLGTIPSANYTTIPDGMMTQAVISALVSISGAYTMSPGRVAVSAYDEFDSADVEVLALDAVTFEVDIDGNGKPDALGLNLVPECTLPDCSLVTPGTNGNPIITVWRPLDTSRAGHQTPEIGVVFISADGAVFVDVIAPTLAAIQAVSTAYDMYDTGRLVLSVAGVPTDLLDGPAGVDPLGEFPADFPGNAPPQNVFALVNIFVSDSTAPDPITQWLALEQLPGGLMIDTDISGPGVAVALAAAMDVYAYSYATTNVQDRVDGPITFALGSLTDYGDEDGWLEITPTLSMTRTHAEPSAGDNTISIQLTSASVITGSDITPRTTTLSGPAGDGGGGGSCFIATAAYGTPLADDINVLRAIRDSYMLNNALGTAFVDMYYRVSPPVADSVANNAVMKAAVRTLLTPVVIVGSFVLAMPGVSVILLLACVALVVARARRRMSRV